MDELLSSVAFPGANSSFWSWPANSAINAWGGMPFDLSGWGGTPFFSDFASRFGSWNSTSIPGYPGYEATYPQGQFDTRSPAYDDRPSLESTTPPSRRYPGTRGAPPMTPSINGTVATGNPGSQEGAPARSPWGTLSGWLFPSQSQDRDRQSDSSNSSDRGRNQQRDQLRIGLLGMNLLQPPRQPSPPPPPQRMASPLGVPSQDWQRLFTTPAASGPPQYGAARWPAPSPLPGPWSFNNGMPMPVGRPYDYYSGGV